MNDLEQIIRINGYIQHKGPLTYSGKQILCVAVDHTCTFKSDEEITLTPEQLTEVYRQTFFLPRISTITILKLDRDEHMAKQLAEEEFTALFGTITDEHILRVERRAMQERYQDKGAIGYLIRVEANLTDEEAQMIRDQHYMREYAMLMNIGQLMIDNVDVGLAWKEFFK